MKDSLKEKELKIENSENELIKLKKEIKEQKNIQNEDNEIVDYTYLKYIMISDINKCVCKIITIFKTG